MKNVKYSSSRKKANAVTLHQERSLGNCPFPGHRALNSRLADCLDLQTQTKQAHWNVRGANFIALHKLFDEINESVEGFSDSIAERAVQLGGTARGTARQSQ